jgi:hypothetical protein
VATKTSAQLPPTCTWIVNQRRVPSCAAAATVGLKRGEAKNAPSRAVCLQRRGMVQDVTFADHRMHAGGLNLVAAAIVFWNTIHLERAVETLRTASAICQRAGAARVGNATQSGATADDKSS